jgi:hypothetical protein
MKRIVQLWIGLGALLLPATAAVPDARLFTVTVALRSLEAPPPVNRSEANSATAVMTLENAREVPLELAIQRYEAMTGSPLLAVPVPRDDPGGAYGVLKKSVFDPITNPEVIRVGKVQMTGGLVGAVKKKNPFYLLNPLVFAVDW